MEDGDSLYARIAELEKQLEAEKSDDMCEEAYPLLSRRWGDRRGAGWEPKAKPRGAV